MTNYNHRRLHLPHCRGPSYVTAPISPGLMVLTWFHPGANENSPFLKHKQKGNKRMPRARTHTNIYNTK